MECNVLIEWYDVVQRGPAKQGDEVAANRKKNEDDINVKDECRRTRNS